MWPPVTHAHTALAPPLTLLHPPPLPQDEIYEYYLEHKTFSPKYGSEVDAPQRPWARVVVAIWCLILGVPLAALIVQLYLSSAWWTLLLMGLIFFLGQWPKAPPRSEHRRAGSTLCVCV